MRSADILLVYEYNYWATGRILAASARLGRDHYAGPAAHSYGSLRGTLVHILEAEYSWRLLCQHNVLNPPEKIDEAGLSSFGDLTGRWRVEEQAMRDYLAQLNDEDLLDLVRYTLDNGQKRARVLWHCLLHVVNHGTQHRAEAAAILTELGQSPGDLDFTLFLNEKGIGVAAE